MSIPEAFAHEYELDALHLTTPRGHDFRMYIAPRHRYRYEQKGYEPFSADLISSIGRGAELFVDIGAQYGFFSLLAASRNPRLQVISVEPTPVTCAVLAKNVKLLDLSNIAIFEFAASDSVGDANFNVSLASDNCGLFQHPTPGNLHSINVRTITIDALLEGRTPCPLVIKISTEGNELAVLKGMKKTLERFEDIKLIIDFNPVSLRAANVDPGALLQHFDELGFEMHLLDESHRKFRRVRVDLDWRTQLKEENANLYCVRRDRAISICFFSHLNGLSGAERALLELVDALVAKYGAACTVVLPGPGPLVTALSKAGAACIFADYRWWCWLGPRVSTEVKNRKLYADVKSVLRFAMPALREFDPDVIWTQTMVIPWGAMIAAQMAKPHVWYVTELGELDHGFTFFEPFQAVIEDIIRSSDQVFTCSQFIAQKLFPNAPNEHVRVLYCYIPPPTTEAPGHVHADFFNIKDAVRLAIFGNSPTKGTEDIVQAVAQLSARGRNVQLLIAGHENADFQQELLKIIRSHDIGNRVKFAGFLPDPYAAMRATDIVVVCSRNEAFGRVGVEAMLLGKPVVFPTTGGVSEYMVEAKTGYSYTPGNIEQLVDRLEILMDQRSRWREMGTFGRTHALQLFSEDGYSGEVYRTLRKLRCNGRKANGMPKSIRTLCGKLSEYVNISRNDRCPCGSGKRYKHCHGQLT